MQRIPSTPRPDWQRRVEALGLHFHTPEGVPYWDESVYYQLTAGQIDEIEKATATLDALCLEAVDAVIAQGYFAPFEIPKKYHRWIRESWERDERTIYGRFDLAYDGRSPPKLLEYNADTPTALLEAAVIQWHWMQELHPGADQFNSIHERLLEAWQAWRAEEPGPVLFASLRGHVEDYMTVNYLRDTALQAGLDTDYLAVEDIGWMEQRKSFVDLQKNPIPTLFKLYPWEWMLSDEFAPHLLEAETRWLEPPWKMLLSNKALLVILYEMFPESPYLLRASFDPLPCDHVRKPLRGREGANIALVRAGVTEVETDGPYLDEPCVYQELAPLRKQEGNYAVLGSWMVNGYPCGLGIREDQGPITRNTSRFVPHLFRP